ncbi:MAG: hypothetical protein AAFV46_03435 [Cyanobacteria bacterium J06635_11]
MRSFREPETTGLPPMKVSLPMGADISVGLATVPFLALLTAGSAIATSLAELGSASEELFRGDRLPTLPLLKAPQDASADQR